MQVTCDPNAFDTRLMNRCHVSSIQQRLLNKYHKVNIKSQYYEMNKYIYTYIYLSSFKLFFNISFNSLSFTNR